MTYFWHNISKRGLATCLTYIFKLNWLIFSRSLKYNFLNYFRWRHLLKIRYLLSDHIWATIRIFQISTHGLSEVPLKKLQFDKLFPRASFERLLYVQFQSCVQGMFRIKIKYTINEKIDTLQILCVFSYCFLKVSTKISIPLFSKQYASLCSFLFSKAAKYDFASSTRNRNVTNLFSGMFRNFENICVFNTAVFRNFLKNVYVWRCMCYIFRLGNLTHESLKSPITEAYTEPCQTSKMELFVKTGNGY